MYQDGKVIYEDIVAMDFVSTVGVASSPYKYAIVGKGVDGQLYLLQGAYDAEDAEAMIKCFKEKLKK